MIYADYNGSAPLCKEVVDYLIERLQSGPYANPNAIHHMGQKCMMGMENARAVCAKTLGALPKNIIFNSGSTEGISQVFFSLLHNQREVTNKDQIFISGIEHSAVIKCARFYELDEGYKVQIIPTLPNGQCDLESLKSMLSEHAGKVAMVSVMAANNETGVIQPYKEIGAACSHSGTPFVCDTTQFIGKAPFNFKESNIDFAFAAGHKIGAMTGAGFVLAKDVNLLKPHVIGGGQEKDLRGGTQNYIGFETIAVAMATFSEKAEKLKKLEKSRDQFEAALKEKYPSLVVMGGDAPRLGGTSFISLPGIHGQAVQIELEANDIYVTTSSACSDNEPTTSKVLKAMGVGDDVGRGAVRISLGTCSPEDGHDKILKSLLSAYEKLSKIGSY
jgi:cysteine desulfurase